MSYPDTALVDDELDESYGGAPADRWGTPARSFIDSVLQVLEQGYLAAARQPYTSVVVYIDCLGQLKGDIVAWKSSTGAAGVVEVKKITALGESFDETLTPILGMLLENVPNVSGEDPTLIKVRIATGGIVPSTITGIGTGVAGRYTVDATTSRLRLQAGVEPTYAVVDDGGNAFLRYPNLGPVP